MRDQIIFLFLGEEKGEKEQFAEMNSAKPSRSSFFAPKKIVVEAAYSIISLTNYHNIYYHIPLIFEIKNDAT